MSDSAEPLSFEKALAELERIVRDLEEGRSGLEDSLAQYEAGVSLLKRCHEQLRQAEQRIALLTGMDSEGRPILRPFAHEASVEKPADKPAHPSKPTPVAPPAAAKQVPAAPAPAAPVPPPPAPPMKPVETPATPARTATREAPAAATTPPAGASDKPRPAGGLLWD